MKNIKKHFCLSHLKEIDLKKTDLKKKLELGHPLHTLISEHEIILGFLDRLEKLNKKIEKENPNEKFLEELKDISHHLIEAEPHHQREEKILFPEIEGEFLGQLK
ncbi:MAG: hemerythrin domain-containing protein [Minisyncoccales bacterium]